MTEILEHTSSIEDISIPRDIARLNELGVLGMLLKDNSTGGNIVWGTSAYEGLGTGYYATDEMTIESITGDNIELIRRRARKDKGERSNLTRTHAEVFTPTWICNFCNEEFSSVERIPLSLREQVESVAHSVNAGMGKN